MDRPAAVPIWSTAPEIELDGSWLLFRYPIRTLRPGRRGEAAATLLTEFVKLDEAPAERILDYARRHGRFGFCKHGDPSHRLRPEGPRCGRRTTTSGQTAVREALQWWRNLAGHARALLNAAAQLSKGRVDDLTPCPAQPAAFLFGAAPEGSAARPSVLRRLWDWNCGCFFFRCARGSLTIRGAGALKSGSAVRHHYQARWHCRLCSQLRARPGLRSAPAVESPSLPPGVPIRTEMPIATPVVSGPLGGKHRHVDARGS